MRHLLLLPAVLALLSPVACSRGPELVQPPPPAEPPAEARALLEAAGLARFASDSPLEIQQGEPSPYPGYTVRPLSFELLPGFRSSAALWLPEGEGPFPGVVVLPGHFGEGKASGECQELAHALAARGVAAIAVDVPGVEEWEIPARQLHFEAGAHNRAALLAAGGSALGLQIQLAKRGLDALLEAAPVDRVAAAGASGGGVLAFWLGLADPRVQAVVVASPVNIPRAGDTGGCYCDALPGHAGPSPEILSALEQPSLWLSELDRPPPAGLPTSARWAVLEGPHSFTAPMRAVALPWLDEQLGHRPDDKRRAKDALEAPPFTPGAALRSATDPGAMSILELAALRGERRDWTPQPDLEPEHELVCSGRGLPIITVGATPEDLMSLRAADWDPCDLRLAPDETWEARAVTSGRALVDRPASALRAASAQHGGAPVYAVGSWTIAAAASGVPWVGREPLRGLDDVQPEQHPAWVHAPGAWWGGLEPLYASALALSDDPDELLSTLAQLRDGAIRPESAAAPPPAAP